MSPLLETETVAPPQAMSFVLSPGGARFDERTMLFGVCANDIKVSGHDTGGRLGVFEYAGKVRGGPPLHLHHDQDEVYLVQEGQYLFQVGEARTVVGPGGVIFLPRGVPHAFAQLGDTGRMLFMFSPAGDMEDYFRALAQLKGPPPPEEEAALFAAHGMSLIGPPIDPGHAAA
ncbi:hypothetical protein BH10PSE4_BH10PSE4_31880 [soil metagenome]